jgi:lysophospholipase L1-like esterase
MDVLNGFRDLTAAHGVRLVILVPWYREFEMHEELLRRFAGENGVDLIDLPMLLKGLPGNRADYFLDITHPNERGHAVIGAAIEASLRAIWDAPPE